MLGGAALLADGILTPAVTVTTAIEGLRTIPAVHAALGDDQGRVVAITLAIIIVLFLVQRIGTAKIGHAFGPIMTLWFLFWAARVCSLSSSTPRCCCASTRCAASPFC